MKRLIIATLALSACSGRFEYVHSSEVHEDTTIQSSDWTMASVPFAMRHLDGQHMLSGVIYVTGSGSVAIGTNSGSGWHPDSIEAIDSSVTGPALPYVGIEGPVDEFMFSVMAIGHVTIRKGSAVEISP
jgi:hypothetical protein